MSPDEIKALRDQLGITQKELADRINAIDKFLRTDRNSVSRWERGVRAPDRHAQAALDRIAGIPAPDGDATLPVGMDRERLADEIRQHGVWEVIHAIGNDAAFFVMGIREGWNLHGWEMRRGQGYVLFARHDNPDHYASAPEHVVIVVNSDDPAIIARHADMLPYPVLALGRSESKVATQAPPAIQRIIDAHVARA